MDTWIALARGPLFRLSLAVCVLGLTYHFGNILLMIIRSYRQAADKNVPWGSVLKATLKWLVPVRVIRANPFVSAASIVFHIGILLLPAFYIGHTGLLGAYLPSFWPSLGTGPSDVLTILAIVGLGLVLVGRLCVATARQLTSFSDALLLLGLLALAATGYWAAHPASAPLPVRTLVLIHMLMGDLVLLFTPFSKIVHCVLYPFTQLVSELGWHFPADSGRQVAIALAKENEPI